MGKIAVGTMYTRKITCNIYIKLLVLIPSAGTITIPKAGSKSKQHTRMVGAELFSSYSRICNTSPVSQNGVYSA
jgi:hypothetical protein